jgi:hypothetical protein
MSSCQNVASTENRATAQGLATDAWKERQESNLVRELMLSMEITEHRSSKLAEKSKANFRSYVNANSTYVAMFPPTILPERLVSAALKKATDGLKWAGLSSQNLG